MRLESGLHTSYIPLDALRPSTDVSALETVPGGVRLTTFSNDPQLQFTYPIGDASAKNTRAAIAAAALLGLAAGIAAGVASFFWTRRGRESRGRVSTWVRAEPMSVLGGGILLFGGALLIAWSFRLI